MNSSRARRVPNHARNTPKCHVECDDPRLARLQAAAGGGGGKRYQGFRGRRIPVCATNVTPAPTVSPHLGHFVVVVGELEVDPSGVNVHGADKKRNEGTGNNARKKEGGGKALRARRYDNNTAATTCAQTPPKIKRSARTGGGEKARTRETLPNDKR